MAGVGAGRGAPGEGRRARGAGRGAPGGQRQGRRTCAGGFLVLEEGSLRTKKTKKKPKKPLQTWAPGPKVLGGCEIGETDQTTYYGPKPDIGEPIAIYLSELEGLPPIVVTKQSDISRQVELIDKEPDAFSTKRRALSR